MENFFKPPKKTVWSKLIFCMLFLTTVFAYTNSNAQYCTPTYGFGACDEFISNVSVASINYGSGCAGASQYEDFTSTFTDVFAGLSYPITVIVGPPFYAGDQVGVFIDWDQNGLLTDAGESNFLTNNGGGSFSGTVNVPSGATLGITRMRVMMTYNVTPEPCNLNASFYGETEDYTVNVQPGPTCPYSTQLNVTNPTTTTADLNWTHNLSASYYKVRYKKVSDPTTVPTWANPTTVLAPTTTLTATGLTAATQYEFQVNSFCSASDSSGYTFSALWNTGCFDCPLTSIPEAEACGTDVNGGCNMPVPFFEPINCGDTICGTAWAEVNVNFPFGGRDTDWFTFDVTVPGVYTIFAKSMFPAQMGYIGPNAACPITAFTDYVTTPNECDSLSLTGYLTVGTWIYFISPSVFDGYSCGSGQNNYLTYVCSTTPPITVANDACSDATLITQNTTCVPTTGDVAGAFVQNGAACVGTAEDDVWYQFVATTNVVTVQVTGSASFYPVAEVFDACGGNQLACIQGAGAGGVATSTLAPLTIGQTYYVRVYDIFATVPATTTFDICVFDAPPSTLLNDFCTDAITLVCGDVVTGTTIGAIDDIAPACGPGLTAPGVWYTLVGDGSNTFISTCTGTTWDTKINVYSGDCNNLVCVGGNDDFCGLQSQVSFVAQIGVNYYILVNGYNGATGDFTIDVVCTPPCILTCSPSYLQENEVCGADVNGGCNMPVPFFEPIACGDTICGSAWMSGGTRDTDWFTVDISTPGIYTFVAITQFPCTMGYIGPNAVCPITQFDQFVNTANECDTLSITSFLAAGTWIYAIVPYNPSFDGYPCGSGKNTYVTYVCAPNPSLGVANDICDSAISITQNASCQPTTGDVAGATIQSGLGCSGGFGEDDVWYSFVATGTSAVVQVTPSASFDAVIEVFDACGGTSVACIDNSFAQGGIESQEVTGLNIGQTYFIGVYDYGFTPPATTTFEICVFDPPAPCVVCPSATALQENEVCGTDANGGCNMAVPTYEPIACGDTVCGTSFADNNLRDTDWYEFTIASPSNVVFTVNSGFPRLVGFVDASLGCGAPVFLVFSQGTLECDTTSAGANLPAGTYWAFVAPNAFNGYPCGGSKSNYTAILTCGAAVPPPANDSCQNAEVVNCGDVVTGSTLYATTDANATFCGTTPEAPGVWYMFAGDGSVVTASMCNGTSYDSKINVYSGDCSTLTCVDGNDDFCGSQSQISFPTFVGTNYYILVNGYNVATGDFQLEITCVPPPPNDDPCGALSLAIGSNGPYDNSSATANPSEPTPPGTDCEANDSWCPFANTAENTLWFIFDAPASGRITINSPGFDTQLAIWDAADCNAILTGGATLIAANDDDPDYATHGGSIFSSYVYSDCLTPGHTYYVQLDGYSGTVGSTDIILSDPGVIDASFTTLNARYCPNASAVTLVPATAGGTFSGPGVSGNIFNPATAGVGGPYSIVYTVLGCITSTQTVTVENPVADISPAGPVTVCFGQAVPLTTPYDPGYTYLWKRGPFTIPGATTNSYTPTWSGTFKYKVKVTDVVGGGCSTKDSVYYTMINFPNPTLIIGACINNTVLLTSSVTASNLNYQWVKGTTPISGATNTSYLVTTNGPYRVAITDSCGTLRFTPLTMINVTTCRIEEMSDEQVAQMVDVALYPNPNEGQFTIDLNSYDLSSSAISVDVYNVLGQVVYSELLTLNEGKLNNLIQLPSSVEDGLYNVRIKKGDYETFTKIVVSK